MPIRRNIKCNLIYLRLPLSNVKCVNIMYTTNKPINFIEKNIDHNFEEMYEIFAQKNCLDIVVKSLPTKNVILPQISKYTSFNDS